MYSFRSLRIGESALEGSWTRLGIPFANPNQTSAQPWTWTALPIPLALQAALVTSNYGMTTVTRFDCMPRW